MNAGATAFGRKSAWSIPIRTSSVKRRRPWRLRLDILNSTDVGQATLFRAPALRPTLPLPTPGRCPFCPCQKNRQGQRRTAPSQKNKHNHAKT